MGFVFGCTVNMNQEDEHDTGKKHMAQLCPTEQHNCVIEAWSWCSLLADVKRKIGFNFSSMFSLYWCCFQDDIRVYASKKMQCASCMNQQLISITSWFFFFFLFKADVEMESYFHSNSSPLECQLNVKWKCNLSFFYASVCVLKAHSIAFISLESNQI